MTSTQFVSIPFTVDGVDFISKIATTCSYLPQILNIGDVFVKMNIDAIHELIGNPSLMTKDELLSELIKLNENGTEMFVELAGA